MIFVDLKNNSWLLSHWKRFKRIKLNTIQGIVIRVAQSILSDRTIWLWRTPNKKRKDPSKRVDIWLIERSRETDVWEWFCDWHKFERRNSRVRSIRVSAFSMIDQDSLLQWSETKSQFQRLWIPRWCCGNTADSIW